MLDTRDLLFRAATVVGMALLAMALLAMAALGLIGGPHP